MNGPGTHSGNRGYPGFTLSESLFGIAILLIILPAIIAGTLIGLRALHTSRTVGLEHSRVIQIVQAIRDFEREISPAYWDSPDFIALHDPSEAVLAGQYRIAIVDRTLLMETPGYSVRLALPGPSRFALPAQGSAETQRSLHLIISMSGGEVEIRIQPGSFPVRPVADEN
jgi:hypothetical protein